MDVADRDDLDIDELCRQCAVLVEAVAVLSAAVDLFLDLHQATIG